MLKFSSPRLQRPLVWMGFIYLSFIGGTTYVDRSFIFAGLHHLLMTAFLLGWLMNLILTHRPFPRTPLDRWVGLYLLVLGLSVVFSHDPRVSLEQSWRWVLHVGLVYFFVDLMQRGSQRWLLEGLFLVAALVVIVSVVEWFSWYFGLGFGGFTVGWFSLGGLSDPIPPLFYRLSLAMNISTWLGGYLVLILPLVVAWGLTARRRDDRRALGLVAVGLLWVLIFSQSRSGLLGLLTAIVIGYGLYRGMGDWKQHFRTRQGQFELATLAILGLAGLGLVGYLSRNRLGGDEGRTVLWETALEIIQAEPLTGVGVYQFGATFPKYHTWNVNTAVLSHAHNLYLNTLAEIGVMGGLVVLGLTLTFLSLTWQSWQQAGYAGRIRFIGVLASLGGLTVASLFDLFTTTAVLLPFLVGVAYILASRPDGDKLPSQPYFALRYALLVGVLLWGIWLGRVDLGQARAFQSALATADEDYEVALSRLQQAQNLDPTYHLYDLQAAYLWGRRAEVNPVYIEDAITHYEQVLAIYPTFDLGYLNLAALYAQQGDYETAIALTEQALRIRPDIHLYSGKLGEYLEASGQLEAALFHYQAALNYNSPLVSSPFWSETETRQTAAELVYEGFDNPEKLFFAVERGWSAPARQVANLLAAEPTQDTRAQAALGFYYAAQGEPEAAIRAYEQALTLNPNQPWVMAQLAHAYLAQGDFEAAETAAQNALFLDRSQQFRTLLFNPKYLRGVSAYAVLAALRQQELAPAESLNDAQINDWLIMAVVPNVILQTYGETVFGHSGYWDYLLQVQPIGLGVDTYQPWLELAQRYEQDDDPTTQAEEVYRLILEYEPSATEIWDLCGTACLTAPLD